jgi:hypothetical protein
VCSEEKGKMGWHKLSLLLLTNTPTSLPLTFPQYTFDNGERESGESGWEIANSLSPQHTNLCILFICITTPPIISLYFPSLTHDKDKKEERRMNGHL